MIDLGKYKERIVGTIDDSISSACQQRIIREISNAKELMQVKSYSSEIKYGTFLNQTFGTVQYDYKVNSNESKFQTPDWSLIKNGDLKAIFEVKRINPSDEETKAGLIMGKFIEELRKLKVSLHVSIHIRYFNKSRAKFIDNYWNMENFSVMLEDVSSWLKTKPVVGTKREVGGCFDIEISKVTETTHITTTSSLGGMTPNKHKVLGENYDVIKKTEKYKPIVHREKCLFFICLDLDFSGWVDVEDLSCEMLYSTAAFSDGSNFNFIPPKFWDNVVYELSGIFVISRNKHYVFVNPDQRNLLYKKEQKEFREKLMPFLYQKR